MFIRYLVYQKQASTDTIHLYNLCTRMANVLSMFGGSKRLDWQTGPHLKVEHLFKVKVS